MISIYYKEKPNYLEKSLCSIIEQSVKPAEVVMIEDGTFDEALSGVVSDFIRECNERSIRVFLIKHETPNGLGKSLNEGIKAANCDYVARFDSDDISLKKRIEIESDLIMRERVAVVGSNVEEFSDNRKTVHLKRVPVSFEEIEIYLKRRNPVNHMSVVFDKRSVMQVGCYDEVPFYEDYLLWAKLVKEGFKISNSDQVLVRARTEKDFVNRRRGIKYAFAEIKLQQKLYRMNIINLIQAFQNSFVRGGVRLLPGNIVKLVYKELRNHE